MCSQQGCTQHDTHTPHQHAAPVQPAPATHTSAGHCMCDNPTPVISTSANSYTTLKLDSWPSLNCCVIGCDVNVDSADTRTLPTTATKLGSVVCVHNHHTSTADWCHLHTAHMALQHSTHMLQICSSAAASSSALTCCDGPTVWALD